MFTGIIETLGRITHIEHQAQNLIFHIQSSISDQLKVDQSVSHNGVCLTVTGVTGGIHTVTAIHETLAKTDLSQWQVGHAVNLERCLPAGGRFDGHFVQGHVDQVGRCTALADEQGSWRYTFEYDPSLGNFTVEKGSIAVNGTSLTVVDSAAGRFSVAIIPYTYEHTSFKHLQLGQIVNLEFDVLGKYLKQIVAGQMAHWLPARG
ncbi:MAG: riboflavin synthase [Bernardetiaceae bacterium]|jgi:riboflavin synthase|nr:riboflavin synthase [Bernardetiaceae bacterium]